MNDQEIKRGRVFYVQHADDADCGDYKNRPAVVVSNDKCNKYSPEISVVYLATREKKPLPTHVRIRSTGRDSTALCEHVSTISKERVAGYVGQCTDEEMKNIDCAVAVALGLGSTCSVAASDCQPVNDDRLRLRVERDLYKQLYEQLIHTVVK